MAVASVAKITGTFLAPGVSLNGRLYTKENIGKAVARMQSAIEDGTAPPLTQLTSHGTDDVLQTVGQLTKVWQADDGSAKYESDVPDTAAGRDLATLTKHRYIRNVSIAGRWLGDVQNVEHEGQDVETGDDLEVVRVDFVPRPGVAAARIDSVAMAEGEPTGDWRDEVKGDVAVVEDSQAPYGNVTYADNGLRMDGKKRYPIDTKAHALAAWSYINQQKNADQYSAADLATVRNKIKAALKKFGVTPREGATVDKPTQEADLVKLDPDGDGDVDALGCPTCGHVQAVTDPALNPDFAVDGGNEKEKEITMTEEAKEEASKLSEADVTKIGEALASPIAQAVAAAVKEAMKPAEVVAPVEEAHAETVEEQVARLVAAEKAKLVAAAVAEGLPTRVGVVKSDGTPKPLHEMSASEFRKASVEVAEALIQPGARYPGINRNNEG